MDRGVIWGVGLFILLLGYGAEVESSHLPFRNLQSIPAEDQQPYRTAYHFQPLDNWMNDPNGPVYYNGVYHLFYQYNPRAAVPSNLSWGHSVSYNLVDWIQLEPALNPSEPYENNGCWSGSTTILAGEIPAILYTGINLENRQVQNLAVPKNLSDPFLREWVKSSFNPLMTPVDGIDPVNFRDPATAWKGPDGLWRVIVGGLKNGSGMAILYRSKDFVNWTRSESPLHSSSKTGMWECPDFYPVSVNSSTGLDTSVQDEFTKHVLKASLKGHDYYILGNYTPKTDNFLFDTDFLDGGFDSRYDYGKFYASKTFYDSAKKRRILWAWVSESDAESNAISRGWAGIQLVQWPIKELEKLRTNKVAFNDTDLKGGSFFEVSGITASQADVEVSFDLPNLNETESIDLNLVDPQFICQKGASLTGKVGPFGLLALASRGLTEQTAIFFRIFSSQDKYVVLMCSDQSRSSLREETDKTTYGVFINLNHRERKISLRSLIDHSVIENFGGDGRACVTARVYPTLAIDKEAHLYVFNNGTQSVRISSLNAWSMKRAQIVPI